MATPHRRDRAARTQFERRGIAAIHVDLCDQAAVLQAVQGHDAVINVATHVPHSTASIFMPWAWRENDRLRRDATATLVKACIAGGVSRFIRVRRALRSKRWNRRRPAVRRLLRPRRLPDGGLHRMGEARMGADAGLAERLHRHRGLRRPRTLATARAAAHTSWSGGYTLRTS